MLSLTTLECGSCVFMGMKYTNAMSEPANSFPLSDFISIVYDIILFYAEA